MKWGLTKRDSSQGSLTNFKDSIDSLFRDFFDHDSKSLFSSSFMPSVDIKEDNKGVYVEAELPGLDEKDIDIELKDRILTIRGEKKIEKESTDGKRSYHLERRYGCFERSFTVSDDVVANKVKASYKKGILKITLPKDEAKAPKKLKINLE